eukprot:TRINITY_DN3232_c1_g1_i1.p1 TRINITY_DN3232_c1_g1~~TRINITY_DN3232_c1_g1_i1.p1  ORF type:complete len:185 (+),score=45.22 TRINITY_DN3232_c1_g1_i1:75-629(+)
MSMDLSHSLRKPIIPPLTSLLPSILAFESPPTPILSSDAFSHYHNHHAKQSSSKDLVFVAVSQSEICAEKAQRPRPTSLSSQRGKSLASDESVQSINGPDPSSGEAVDSGSEQLCGKQEIRRLHNRLASRRCRSKIRSRITQLEKDAETLAKRQQELLSQVARLVQENETLRASILTLAQQSHF